MEHVRTFITGSGAGPLREPLGAKFVQEVNAVTMAVDRLHPDVGSVDRARRPGRQDHHLQGDRDRRQAGRRVDERQVRVGHRRDHRQVPDQGRHAARGGHARCSGIRRACITWPPSAASSPKRTSSIWSSPAFRRPRSCARWPTPSSCRTCRCSRAATRCGPRCCCSAARTRSCRSCRSAGGSGFPKPGVARLSDYPTGCAARGADRRSRQRAVLRRVRRRHVRAARARARRTVPRPRSAEGVHRRRTEGAARRLGRAAAGRRRRGARAFRTTYAIPRFMPATLSPGQHVRGVIGLDGGSTSSKAVLMDEQRRRAVQAVPAVEGQSDRRHQGAARADQGVRRTIRARRSR